MTLGFFVAALFGLAMLALAVCSMVEYAQSRRRVKRRRIIVTVNVDVSPAQESLRRMQREIEEAFR